MNPFEEIKRRLSITELLNHYDVRKGRGLGSYYCPIHENSGQKHKPSLVATDQRGTVKCMAKKCFDNDDIFGFIEKYEECNKSKALQIAAELSGVTLEKTLTRNSETSKKEHKKTSKRISGLEELQKKHIQWLEKRGIDSTIAFKFGLKARDEFIAFPHWKNSVITGWKIKSIIDKSKLYQYGPESGATDLKAKLWHMGVLDHTKITHLIFVEGEPDCLLLTSKCNEKGLLYTGVVTSTAGAGTIPPEVTTLKKYFPTLKRISIFYDNDQAGLAGAKKLAQALMKTRVPVHIHSFPNNTKEGYDITDFFQEGHSIEQLFQLSAEVLAPYYSITPAIDHFDEAYAQSTSIQTGFIPTFDKICNGLNGLVVFGGETGIGKTTFMINIAYQAAKQQHPLLYVSYELGYTELRVKLAAMTSKYGYSLLNKQRDMFLQARESINSDPSMKYLKIIDTSLLSLGIDYIQDGILALKEEFPNSKPPMIIIDYLQGMPIDSGSDYRLSLASTVQGLRDIVRQHDVVVFIASATNTQRRGTNSIHAGVFRESSEIEYSAYQALVLAYKEDQKENGNVMKAEIQNPYLFVVKNRFGGKCTEGIPLKINWEQQTYSEKKREIV